MKRPYKVPAGNSVGIMAIVLSFAMATLYMPGAASALVWPYKWAIIGGWSLLGADFYFWARASYGTTYEHEHTLYEDVEEVAI